MNEMGRVVGNPDFRFPRNRFQVFRERLPVRKRRYKHQPSLAATEYGFQFLVPLGVDRAVGGDGLGEDQPIALRVVDDDVWHLSVVVYVDAE